MLQLGVIGECYTIGRLDRITLTRLDGRDIVCDIGCTEALGLFLHAIHKIRAKNTFRESGEVLHLSGVDQLSTWRQRTSDHNRIETCAAKIDGGRVASGTRTDNDDVMFHVKHCHTPIRYSVSFSQMRRRGGTVECMRTVPPLLGSVIGIDAD